MNENIITWNFVNWLTIVLMAAVGFLILAAAGQVFHKLRGTGDGSSSQALGAAGMQ